MTRKLADAAALVACWLIAVAVLASCEMAVAYVVRWIVEAAA